MSKVSQEFLDKLELSTSNAAQKQLLDEFSHETRGFLSVIGGLMEVLDEAIEARGDEEQKDLIKKTRSHTEKFTNYLNKFVEVMLDEWSLYRGCNLEKEVNTKITKNKELFLKDLMHEVTAVFSGILFDNKLTVDIHLVPELKVPDGKGQRLKLLIVSLVSHLAKVVENCHLIIFGSSKDGKLNLVFEIYVTNATKDLRKIVECGCSDTKRIVEEIGGKSAVLQITSHQVNVSVEV